METTTKKLNEDTASEKMATLSSSIALAAKRGYTTEFTVKPNGMLWDSEDRYYHPEEVAIDNFYRFEGESDPADSSVLYLITTADGKKGTLTDAYGAYGNADISTFIREVNDIRKQINTARPHGNRFSYITTAILLLAISSGLLLLTTGRKKRKNKIYRMPEIIPSY